MTIIQFILPGVFVALIILSSTLIGVVCGQNRIIKNQKSSLDDRYRIIKTMDERLVKNREQIEMLESTINNLRANK